MSASAVRPAPRLTARLSANPVTLNTYVAGLSLDKPLKAQQRRLIMGDMGDYWRDVKPALHKRGVQWLIAELKRGKRNVSA